MRGPDRTDRASSLLIDETVRKVCSSAFRRKFVIFGEIHDTNFRLKAELRT